LYYQIFWKLLLLSRSIFIRRSSYILNALDVIIIIFLHNLASIESMKKAESGCCNVIVPPSWKSVWEKKRWRRVKPQRSREADWIYVRRRARFQGSRFDGGMKVRSLVDVVDKKSGPTPYLVARCAYIRSNHGRLFKLFASDDTMRGDREKKKRLPRRNKPKAARKCLIFQTFCSYYKKN